MRNSGVAVGQPLHSEKNGVVGESDREEPEGLGMEKKTGKEGEEEESEEEEEEGKEELAIKDVVAEDREMEKGGAEKEGESRGVVEEKEIEETGAMEEGVEEDKDRDGDVNMAVVE
jgi:hypothetical protein